MNEIDLIKQKEQLIESCPLSFAFYNIPKLLKTRNTFLEGVHNLQNEIRKTDTYYMLANEYQIYVDLLSSFFQQQGITTSKKVNIFYQNLLNLGYLSYQNSYTYDYAKLSSNYCIFECKELEGARVASGIAVCRHTTMLLNDLQNMLKNRSYSLDVFTENSGISGILAEKIARQLQIEEPNHMINLLKTDDNLFYGYCSTHESFFNIKQKGKKLTLSFVPSSRRFTLSSVISQSQLEKEKWKNFLEENWCNEVRDWSNEVHNLIAKLNDDFDTSIFQRNIDTDFKCTYKQKINIEQLNSDRLMRLEQEVIKQTIDNKKEIKDFYEQTKGQLYRIHSLYNTIVPLTNEKVKKLVIK